MILIDLHLVDRHNPIPLAEELPDPLVHIIMVFGPCLLVPDVS